MKIFLINLLFCFHVYSHPCANDKRAEKDQVTFLPGLDPQPTFKHYSGYLRVTEKKSFHYWFVESQGSPQNDPLVLWFNGGPGCSSLFGLLEEHGPFLVTGTGGLKYNNNSWNKIANVLYLESPAGVGFSYNEDGNDIYYNDDQVADENYVALLQFYNKFPQFNHNELYISGESYAGHYVPTLAVRVLQNSAINFKGILIGNGYFSPSIDTSSQPYYAYYHGFLGKKQWDYLVKNCCHGMNETSYCQFSKISEEERTCANLLAEASGWYFDTFINPYNIYQRCEQNNKNSKTKRGSEYFSLNLNYGSDCLNSTAITTYLNDPVVRNVLHVNDKIKKWESCNDPIYLNYKKPYSEIKDTFSAIAKHKKIRILLYNGDLDTACNFIGVEWFVASLGLIISEERRVWHFIDSENSRQVGGYVESFSNNFTLATVRGAGHMVPMDTPFRAYHLFKSFLHQQRI